MEIKWDDLVRVFSPEIMEAIRVEKENNTEEYLYKKKQEHQVWLDRYKIPKGLNKSQLNKLKREIKERIEDLKEKWREAENNEISKIFLDILQDEWIEKKNKIEFLLKPGTEMNIEKAKQYPIDQLLKFRGNVIKCIFHEDQSPSMYFYKNENRVHCFGCNLGYDAIDVFMKINGVEFKEAVKNLCPTN